MGGKVSLVCKLAFRKQMLDHLKCSNKWGLKIFCNKINREAITQIKLLRVKSIDSALIKLLAPYLSSQSELEC